MPERFVKPVLFIIAISQLIWILFGFIFRISKKTKYLKISLKKEIIFFLFYNYSIGVMSLTIFPLPFYRFKESFEDGINLIPVINIIKGSFHMFPDHEFFSGNFQNIVGNIILFMPLGIFAPLLFHRFRPFKKMATLACICSVSIELTQLILRQFAIYRMVDIDDVILNTSGAILGFVILHKLYLSKIKRI